MVNLLSAEGLLISRLSLGLKDILPSVKIESYSKYEDIEFQAQYTPCVYVGDGGASVGHVTSRGSMVKIKQNWDIVTAVFNSSNIQEGRSSREEAGVIMMPILTLLSGFQLSSDHNNLALVEVLPSEYEEGYSYFTMRFMTEITITSKN